MDRLTIRGRRYRRPTKPSLRTWMTPPREHRRHVPIFYSRCHLPEEGFSVFYMSWNNGEGMSFDRVVVYWDTDTVIKQSGGSDCDGFEEDTAEYRILADGTWTLVEDDHYDHFAQAAGY